jgi:hypothetical protein
MEAASGGVPRLRPLDLGGTLDMAIKIVTRHAGTLMLAVLVVVVPFEVLSLLIVESTTTVYDVGASFALTGPDSGVVYSDEGAYAAGQIAVGLVTILTSLLSTVACFKAVADAYLGRRPRAGSSLRYAARRLHSALWLTFVMVVVLVPAFLALVVPGIWLLVAYSVALPALLVERVRGFAALRRSFRLVKGHWLRVFLTLLVAWILISVLQTVVTAALVAVAVLALDPTSFAAHVMEAIANIASSALTTPFLSAVTVVIYFDLRVRKEGFDLAVLAERLGGAVATEPVATAPTSTPEAPLYRGFAPPVGPDPPAGT